MISKKYTNNGKVVVTFTLPASIWAESIALVGDFNGWDIHSHPFTRARDDENWQVTVELERGKSYQFCYLINNTEWQTDAQADGSAPNPFGGENSIINT